MAEKTSGTLGATTEQDEKKGGVDSMQNKQARHITMKVVEMKNAGLKQQEWSDDEQKWKLSGPQYVRVVARMADDEQSFVRMEAPSSAVKSFRIGDEIVVHVTHVTCVATPAK